MSGNSWGVIVEQVRVRRKVGRQAGWLVIGAGWKG